MSDHKFQPKLARRLDGVSESATLKLNAAVQAMRAQGIDVVNLTAGEPDFNVPEAAKKAVIDALGSREQTQRLLEGVASGELAGTVKMGGHDVPGAKIVEAENDKGYTFEASVPWSVFAPPREAPIPAGAPPVPPPMTMAS